MLLVRNLYDFEFSMELGAMSILSTPELKEIRDKVIEQGIRLMLAVESTLPGFQINPENMSKVRKQLFKDYPETEKVVARLRLENRIEQVKRKFEEFKNDPDIAIEIELQIKAMQRDMELNS